jgi:hypothetical protein
MPRNQNSGDPRLAVSQFKAFFFLNSLCFYFLKKQKNGANFRYFNKKIIVKLKMT